MGATGEWNLDQVRFARENREPVEYLAMSYYERWIHSIAQTLIQRGVISIDELGSKMADVEQRQAKSAL